MKQKPEPLFWLETLEPRIAPASNVFANYTGIEVDKPFNLSTENLTVVDASADLTDIANTVAADGLTLFDSGDSTGYLAADRSVLVYTNPADPDLNFGFLLAPADLTGKTAAERLAFIKGEFNGLTFAVAGSTVPNSSGTGFADVKVLFDGKGGATLTLFDGGSTTTTKGTYTLDVDGKIRTAGTYSTFGFSFGYAFEGRVSYDGLKLFIDDKPPTSGPASLTTEAAIVLVKAGTGMSAGNFPVGSVFLGTGPLVRAASFETLETKLTLTSATTFEMLYDSFGSNFSTPETFTGTYTITSTGTLTLKGTGLPVTTFDVSSDFETMIGLNLDTAAAGDNDSGAVFLVRAPNSSNDFLLNKNATFNLDTGGTAALTLTNATAKVTLADQSVTLGTETVNFTPIQFSRIEQIEITSVSPVTTTPTAKLGVTLGGGATATTIDRIFTTDTGLPIHLDSVSLGKGITLGDGVADSTPDLLITGVSKNITLDDVAANSLISLGKNLNYNNPTNTLDTYGNRPNLTLGDVGSNVEINVLDDNADGLAGTGGGGLGNILIGSWDSGSIKTTQSIGTLTLKSGDFSINLEVDQFHDGNLTNANAGLITVTDGDVVGSIFVEGTLAGIKVGGFSGVIQAGAISSISVSPATATAGGSRDLQGAITIGGTGAPLAITGTTSLLATLTTSQDFLAVLETDKPIGSVTISGDFKGSLKAPSIGALTAKSFDGAGVSDFGVGGASGDIVATSGAIGSLKATSGNFANYDIQASGAFGGITVARTGLTTSQIGINNVTVSALSIGNLAVSLAGSTAALAPAIDLVGISNSTFTTTGTGTTAATKGSIGTITVGLTGRDVSGTWQGLQNSNFNASPGGSSVNSIGNVAISATATAGTGVGEIILVGFTNFTADTLGNFTLNGKATSDAGPLHGWMNSDLTAHGTGATGKIGNLSVALTGSSNQTTSTAITGTTIIANNGALGNITTTQTNQAGTILGINGVNVTADTIGTISSTITGKTGLAITSATALNGFSLNADGLVVNKAGNIGTITAKVDLAGSAGTAVVADNLFTTATGTLGNLSFTALSSNAAANLTGLGTFGLAATGSVGTFTVLAQNTNAAVLPSGTGTVAAISTPSAATFLSSFTGSVGAVKVTAAGGAASTQSTDTLNPLSISALQNVGTVTFITTKSAKVAGATAEGVRDTVITATNGDVGALSITGETTAAQVDGLTVTAGGKIGAIAVSATTKANGDLLNSTFQAGADNTVAATTSLIAESIGAVTVSGDAINTFLFAFGNIGAVKTDGVLADSLVVAGIKLGNDNVLSAGDTFNRHASISSLTVGGALSTTSVVAGIDHGGDGVWGQGNDTVGAAIAGIAAKGKIGAVVLGAGSGAYTTPAIASHNFAIESLGITSLKVGATTTTAAALAGGGYLDSNTAATEDTIDTLVRILVPV